MQSSPKRVLTDDKYASNKLPDSNVSAMFAVLSLRFTNINFVNATGLPTLISLHDFGVWGLEFGSVSRRVWGCRVFNKP